MKSKNKKLVEVIEKIVERKLKEEFYKVPGEQIQHLTDQIDNAIQTLEGQKNKLGQNATFNPDTIKNIGNYLLGISDQYE